MLKYLTSSMFKSLFIAISLLISTYSLASPKEGMYPVSQVKKIRKQLKEAGLNIPINRIYNTDTISLLNAIVRIGGCTGSFVSPEGLILTNHHCVFSSLKPHSKEGQNYMETGFLASASEKELPMKGLEVKIMRGYEDISAQVLKDIEKETDPIRRQGLINRNMEDIRKAYQDSFPDFRIEVSEMLIGKSYVLFKYQMLKDLRIVYVPPRSVGEFGGATDNWEWPRHTGDFSFVRAYIGKDGQPAEYDPSNVPFSPDKHLEVNAGGLDEGDFVFILGYPGRTFRHRSAEYIRFQQQYQLPLIQKFYKMEIDHLKSLTEQKEFWKIKYDPRIKSLDNVEKNYRGKMKAMEGIGLYEKRKKQEQEIVNTLGYDRVKQQQFREVLNRLDTLYGNINERGKKIFWYYLVFNASDALNYARLLETYADGVENAGEQDSDENNTSREVLKSLRAAYRKIDMTIDSSLLRKYLLEAGKYSGKNEINGLYQMFEKEDYREEVNEFIEEAYGDGVIFDTAKVFGWVMDNPGKILKLRKKDPLVKFYHTIEEDFIETNTIRLANFSAINMVLPQYVDLKMEATKSNFIPDANATLRLTYGHIEGYSPMDGVKYRPFTSIQGYAQKATDEGDYHSYPPLVSAVDNVRTKYFVDKDLDSVPLCFLYSTDTTGGNSGSPVLNKNGELIGLNFDRTFEATINDFEWDHSYSRSIGVDIRFILWFTQEIGGAGHLVKEMGVDYQ